MAPILAGVTLTGADERTDLIALARLAVEYPALEVGLLYSATPEGRHRYPRLSWIETVVGLMPGRCAVHVCGRGARAAMMDGALGRVLPYVHRVQVNGHVEPGELAPLAARFPIIITQWQPGRDSHDFEDAVASNRGLCHQWLVDGSGGRGQAPAAWSRPACRRPVGFAGGLGPETLDAALPNIAAIAEGAWWIDMESSLRTNDWFDLDRCRAVLARVATWCSAGRATPDRTLGSAGCFQ